MRTVKEFINSEKYVKDLDPILNSFLLYQGSKGNMQDDYIIKELIDFFNDEYNTAPFSNKNITAIWSFIGLLEDGVLV